MQCPYCFEQMVEGKITSWDSFHWQPGASGEVPIFRLKNSKPPKDGVAISQKLSFYSHKCIAHYCVNCDKVVIDLKVRTE